MVTTKIAGTRVLRKTCFGIVLFKFDSYVPHAQVLEWDKFHQMGLFSGPRTAGMDLFNAAVLFFRAFP